ncbi:MAG: hypothetical protein DRR16_20570 [Candidatus Parabeggiatoa sp. nov. 3]|nr:MAG: hypothetical protein DRR16_20570 [Gammaproteobacteria bacterium]
MSGISETARNNNMSLPRSEWKKVFISYQLSVISYQLSKYSTLMTLILISVNQAIISLNGVLFIILFILYHYPKNEWKSK